MKPMRTARPMARLRQGRTDWYRVNLLEGTEVPTAELYIYDEIGYWGVTANDLAKELIGLDVENLTVHLNSPGGEVYDGITIYNVLRDHKAKIHVIIDGLAASAASFIAMAGDEISMQRNAEMMIHDAWGMCIGPAEDMLKMADDLSRLSENIADIYAQRAGGKAANWRKLMLAETWFSAAEAHKAGLCDEVLNVDPGTQDSVDWDLTIFTHAGRRQAPAPSVDLLPVREPEPEPPLREYDPSALRAALDEMRRQ